MNLLVPNVCLFLSIIFFLNSVVNASIEDPEYGKWFQGDIVLTKQQKQRLRNLPRNGLIDSSRRWPGNTLIYEISSSLRGVENQIQSAMQQISSGSCIKFKKRTNERGYVSFQSNRDGCFSMVGYLGTSQPLNLSYGCHDVGTIIHEILHALGFLHMQSAFDRDNYVEILFQNIKPGVESNFRKEGSNVVSHMGGSYDLGSIMHYSGRAFTNNGQLTIRAKDQSKQHLMGNRSGMTDGDKRKLNHMYKCHFYGYGKKGAKYCVGNPTLEGCKYHNRERNFGPASNAK